MLSDNELNDIRRKLVDLEEAPPRHGWRNIAADLRPWWQRPLYWWGGAGLLLLLGIAGGLLLQQGDAAAPGTAFRQEQPAHQTPQKGVPHNAAPQATGMQQPLPKSSTRAGSTQAGSTRQEGPVPGDKHNEQVVAGEAAGQDTVHASHLLQQPAGKGEAVPVQRTSDTGENTPSGVAANAPQHSSQTPLPPSIADPSATAGSPVERQEVVPAATPPGEAIAGAASPHNESGPVASERALQPGLAEALRPAEEGGSRDALAPAHAQGGAAAPAAVHPLAASTPGQAIGSQGVETSPGAVPPDASLAVAGSPTETALPTAPESGKSGARLPHIGRRTAHLPLEKGGIVAEVVPLAQPATATSADEEAVVPVREKKEWALGLFFTPRYTYRSFVPRGEDNILITGMSNQNLSGRDRIGYALGASYSRSLSPRLQLEGSLSLLKLRENISYTYTDGTLDSLVRRMNAQGELEVSPVYASQERQLVSAYAYGSLQVGVAYAIWQRGYRRFTLAAGGGVNLLVRGQTQEYLGGTWVQTVHFPSENNLLEQSNFDVHLGAGYSNSLYRTWEFGLMPMLNYYLGSTFQSREPYGLRSYTLGLKVQLRRRFAPQAPLRF